MFWGFLHGVALSIHRLWQTIGFTLPKIIAWIITFNFVNVAWVFFRAKEWEDAIKVLKGMVGMSGVVFTHKMKAFFDFIGIQNIEYGWVYQSIPAKDKTTWLIIASIIFILVFKNSIEKMNNFKVNKTNFYFNIFLFLVGVSLLKEASEFLYFNF